MSWHAKRLYGYEYTSTEAKENAQEIYSVLSSLGWTLEAVCGFLGNVNGESGFNPWRWQYDVVLASTDDYNITHQNAHAYGLAQFDPAGKYIRNSAAIAMPEYGPNYSDVQGKLTDGIAQLKYINDYADYIPTSSYPISYADYKRVTLAQHDIAWITHAWFSNYERGTWDSGRVTAAQYMYDYLSGEPPIPPHPPTPIHVKVPIWMMLKPYSKYKRRY